MPFSELLARSAFSFLRGASQPEEMVERAHSLGLRSLGLCDRNGLYGAVRAFAKARELGLRVHVGAELTLAPHGVPIERSDPPRPQGALAVPEPATLVLLARDAGGYAQLCRLLTRAHAGLPKDSAWLEREVLGECHSGLFAILPVQLEYEREHRVWFGALAELFHGRAAVAVQRCLDAHDARREHLALRWSRLLGWPIIASNRPSFHASERKPLADILYCIRNGTTLDQAGCRLEPNAEAYLRSEAQMTRLFRHHPDWVQRTTEIADELTFDLGQIRYQFPCRLEPGEDPDQRLARLTWQGAARRYPGGVPESVRAQLEFELGLIGRVGVASYFLCTWEIVEIARERRILCQGRGSAANSAVCYALGITSVDPARSNLLFARFLSEERHEPPDIDVDFEHERREEVIQEIYRRYGREHAAMVSEVICYRGKSALREVGKALGLSLEQVDRISGSLSHWDTAPSAAQLKEYGFDPHDRRLGLLLRWARELVGFPRHLSIHVGGFVLSRAPLHQIAPVEPARMPGRSVIPWDKDDLDTLGFFKVDVLGLGMLTAIRKGLQSIFEDGALRAHPEESFDPLELAARVPAEDPLVYARISEADTIGVFQIESRAQMSMLPRLRPQCFYDLVIEVAIVRPGPIQGGMVHPYLRRRNGEDPVSLPHPSWGPILDRTLGVPLFQEQVMQLAIVGAGYTGGEADQLRRDMAAWKKSGKLLRHRERLLAGFSRSGISREFAEALFEQIKGFGDYGFPESHAASFAALVYASAWQKTHFPAHFCCALLNSQPMGFYSPASLVRDAQKHGVEVRPVRVGFSHWDSSLEPLAGEPEGKRTPDHSSPPGARRALRLGFRLIKGFGERWAAPLVQARELGPFTSLEDFRIRTRLPREPLLALAEAGAFEDLEAERRRAAWSVRAAHTPGLFARRAVREAPVALPALQPKEQLLLDYERVGLSLHDHPLCHLRQQLNSHGVLTARALNHVAHRGPVRIAGLVLSRQRPGTAGGVVFITLEDETGQINLLLFSKIYERFHTVARHAKLLFAEGRLERHLTPPRPGEVGHPTPIVHVIVTHLQRLDDVHLVHRSRDFH